MMENQNDEIRMTNDQAHEPGPWHAELVSETIVNGRRMTVWSVCNEERQEIAITTFCIVGDDGEVNARMMAAGPEMFDCLRFIAEYPAHPANYFGFIRRVKAMAQAEISRATKGGA